MSGKSSVLESLTGFAFPRAPELCTRFATSIACCREAEKIIVVSIISRDDADEQLRTRLLEFERHLVEIDNDALARVFDEVINDTIMPMVNSSSKMSRLNLPWGSASDPRLIVVAYLRLSARTFLRLRLLVHKLVNLPTLTYMKLIALDSKTILP